MKYYLDVEFNEGGPHGAGALISMAVACEDGRSIYMVMENILSHNFVPGEWVKANVIPIINKSRIPPKYVTESKMAAMLEKFFEGDPAPHVIADWPIDFAYFTTALIVGPGMMIKIPGLIMEVKRVDAYPSVLEDAVQHNAHWDAMALMHLLEDSKE